MRDDLHLAKTLADPDKFASRCCEQIFNGDVPLDLLAVSRLCAPGSELSIHERWFSRTAMSSRQ